MRIAVVGGGVAGLYAAWHLAGRHDVVLLEREERIGGHTDTHVVEVERDVGPVAVDTGFIVFNPPNYPLFSAWLERLGVESRPTDMSFGVSCGVSGLVYNASTLGGLFCQRRNLVRPAFLGMVRDILRFYRTAPALLERLDESTTLGEWLAASAFGAAFGRDHLVPMAAALWSSPDKEILDFPMCYMLEFMRNHSMLQARGRPLWRTVRGGSRRYVDAALAGFKGRVATASPVRRVVRSEQGVRVETERGALQVDQVVLACHADQALALIDRPGAAERDVLGAFRYQRNEMQLHTDITRLPLNRRAWASWNVRRDPEAPDRAAISYWMNRLQGLPGRAPLVVSLNQSDRVDPARVLVRRQYRHPVYTPAARAAQRRLASINGRDRLWFCGACWGWGFHEDAVRSARDVVDGIAAEAVDRAA